MSEIGLDELTKQKYEAQMLLEALQYQQSLNALKKKSNELNDLTVTHRNNVKQIIEKLDSFKQYSQAIVEKLKSTTNYINIERESGIYLKNIFDAGCEMLNTKLPDAQLNETSEETVDPFLPAANKILQKHQQFVNAATKLTPLLNDKKSDESTGKANDQSAEKTISVESDYTICSDRVFSSSPIQ